jgi:hypothetical protein
MATLTTTPIKTFVSGETVTPTKLNELSQSTVALTAGTIVAADIASDAVTNVKIASGVDASKLTTGTLPIARIADAAVTAAKLAPKVTFPNYGSISSLSFVSDSVAQAATDGFLLVNVTGSFMNGISVYVGTTNNPTTKIWHNGNNLNGYNWADSSGLLPIPKDTYYKIVNDDVAGNNGAFETVNAFWIPAQT